MGRDARALDFRKRRARMSLRCAGSTRCHDKYDPPVASLQLSGGFGIQCLRNSAV
jgi:hypothetical protein